MLCTDLQTCKQCVVSQNTNQNSEQDEWFTMLYIQHHVCYSEKEQTRTSILEASLFITNNLLQLQN